MNKSSKWSVSLTCVINSETEINPIAYFVDTLEEAEQIADMLVRGLINELYLLPTVRISRIIRKI